MRRLIRSRGVWLALAAAVAAVVVVVIVRARRPRADEAAADEPPTRAEDAPMAHWPPAPILGTPTEEDLKRYAHQPYFFDRLTVAGLLAPREPRPPLDEVTRRRLARWAVAGFALVVLAAGTHLMESAVFSKDPGEEIASQDAVVAHGTTLPCADPLARCEADVTVTIPEYVDDSPPDADCRPGNAPPHVRKIDPKVTRAVNRQWRRIERWLKANAPKTYRLLGKPAKARTIAVAEAQMGLRFPDDLKASLLRHNGPGLSKSVGGFGFLGNSHLSVRNIRDTWRMLCGLDWDHGGDPRSDWWDGRMIPVGANGSGEYLVVDSVKHDVGSTDHEGHMRFRPGGVRIGSYRALLKATADALEGGSAIGWWKPVTVSGGLSWEVL